MNGLGINGGYLLAQILNFLVIFVVAAIFAWKPLIRYLNARSVRIAKGLEDARLVEQSLTNAKGEAQKILDQAHMEANRQVTEGQLRGEEQATSVREAANLEAGAIRTKALQDTEEKRNALLSEVRSEVVELAIAAAGRVIGESLVDSEHARAVIDDFFTEAPADVQNLGPMVEVTSALPLTDAKKEEIRMRLGTQEVSFRVDPSILGGLILRSGQKQIDGSARLKLAQLAESLR